MGTKVQLDNYFPGHRSMRDLGRDSNGRSWPGYYGENDFPNGHYYYGFSTRTVADSFPGYDREVMKQKMLEHEAIFKNQVYELHRVYHVQRQLMDEVRRNGLCKQGTPYETSSSSSPLPPQLQLDAQKWNALSFPSADHASGGQPAVRPNVIQSANAMNVESYIQAGPIPFQGCSSPKGSEVSDSRPTKYGREMFDLELPAAEYIDADEVEQCRDGKASGIDNHLPVKRTCRIAPASEVKVFPNHFERVECNGDAPESSLRKSSVLADLNEPVQIEETTGATSVDFLSCATCDEFQHRGHSSTFLGVPKDAVQNQRHGNMNGTSNSSHFGNKGDKPGWFSYVIDAEKNKCNVRSINLGLQPEKSHAPYRPVQLLLDQPAGSIPNDYMRGDLWKPKASSGLETSDGSYCLPHVPSAPSFFHSSDVGNSWEHSVSSWGRRGSGLTQRSPSVQANPFLASATFSRSCQSSNTPSNEFFGSLWHPSGNDRPTSGFGTELPLQNGFYHGGSSSGFKEPALRFPSIGSDHAGNSNNGKSALGSGNIIKTETGTNVNTMKDFNLNVAEHPNGFSDEWITQQGAKTTDREQRQDEPLAALPWLRSNGASLNESLTLRKCSNSPQSALFGSPIETGKGFDSECSIGPILCDGGYAKVNGHVSSISKKIMGVPILEKPSMLKNEASSAVNISSGPLVSRDEEIQRRGKKRVLDINAPCDSIDLETSDSADDNATAGVQKKTDGRTPIIGNHFDLNSCIFEDEELVPRTSLANGSATISVKVGSGIDLEAPVVIENEDENSVIEVSASVQQPKVSSELMKERADRLVADLAQSAAEAIVAISSNVRQSPASVDVTPIQVEGDPLSWFVDIACSCPGDFERQPESALGEKIGVGNDEDCLSAELDYFESMSLKLTECTAEEYMPGPFLPELPNTEDTRSSGVGTRSRRGQGRRGRQRRDFQRDILPGLASLSRHEVTEDLQKFGGLMRATGHAWQSGSRRNATRGGGCGRGRRRAGAGAASQPPERTTWSPLKQQLSTEVALGWGKTTRRPRRQRCPAGNLTTVAST